MEKNNWRNANSHNRYMESITIGKGYITNHIKVDICPHCIPAPKLLDSLVDVRKYGKHLKYFTFVFMTDHFKQECGIVNLDGSNGVNGVVHIG